MEVWDKIEYMWIEWMILWKRKYKDYNNEECYEYLVPCYERPYEEEWGEDLDVKWVWAYIFDE